MIKLDKKFSRGFGIIEVLISSAIIIVLVFALTTSGKSALNSSGYYNERTQASFLAQDAIEKIRALRDDNSLYNTRKTSWKSFFVSDLGSKPLTFTDVTLGKCYRLSHLDDLSGEETVKRYALTDENDCSESAAALEKVKAGSQETDQIEFSRVVKIEETGSLLPPKSPGDSTDTFARDNAVKVTVKVGWESVYGQKSVEVSEILTNWRPNF